MAARRALLALALGALLALPGCGWEPLYADRETGPADLELRAIKVDPIAERIGQRLALALRESLNPDGAEGVALINFLQSNGIPFSAFRTAIPGVATGPHIHIGMPSHRY